MRATIAWGLVCVSLLSACGDDDGGTVESVTQLIGPEGGTVELSGGGKVEIPAGALSADTRITITKLNDSDALPELPDNLEPAGKPFAFKPHGTMFALPVKVEVPYEGSELNVRPVKLPNEAPDQDPSDWTTVAPSMKDTANSKVSGDVMSFSVIMAARPRRGSSVITLLDGAIVEDSGVIDGGGSGGTGGTGGSGGTGAIDGGGSGAIDGGGSGGTGGSGGGNAAALYPNNGSDWTDYVVNDGNAVTSASDTACDPVNDGPGYDACLHGGEMRVIEIPGQSSCTGLTISDALDAFTWTCLGGTNPVRAVSTGLRPDRYLSDLIDFTTATWKPNSVSVYDATETTVFNSAPAAWWSNPIVIDNDGMVPGDAVPGTVYIVNQDVTADYSVNGSNVAFVVQPGFSITPVVGQYAALYLGDPNNSDPINFNWIEGTVNGNNGTGVSGNEHRFSMLRHLTMMPPLNQGFGVYCAKSMIVDFQSYDTTYGMILAAKECTVRGARIENTAVGIVTGLSFSDAATGPNTLENITIEGSSTFSSGQTGITLGGQLPGNTLRNVSIHNQRGVGIQVDTANNRLEQIQIIDTGSNTSDGIVLVGTDNVLEDITISGGSNRGIVAWGYGQRINNVKLSRMFNWGIDLNGYGHRVSNVVMSRLGGGLRLYNAFRNTIYNVMIGNTGDATYGGNGTGLQTTFTGNAPDQRADNIFSNVYLVNNGIMGLEIGGSQSNLFQYMTVANTGHLNNIGSTMDPVSYGGRGVRFGTSYCKGNSFNNLLLQNNPDSGLDINPHITGTPDDYVTGTVFNHLAVLNNGKRNYGSVFGKDIGTGIRLGELATDVRFFGTLLLANNGINVAQNCHVFSDSTVKTEAGLTDSSLATTCVPVGGSTATLDTSATVGSGAFGVITGDDAINTFDSSGAAQQTDIPPTQWFSFENSARNWGPNSSLLTGSLSNCGMCPGAGGCRIYDWSLAAGDPDVRAVLPVPTGDDALTHTFYATDSTLCAAIPATWNGNACQSTFLINAQEIMDDSIGNENTLCESGETCLYTPNIGAYQGHGNLISAGAFTPGVVTGVTLMRYETNGR